MTSEMFQSFIGCISNYTVFSDSQTSAEITLMTQLSGCLDKLSSATNVLKTTFDICVAVIYIFASILRPPHSSTNLCEVSSKTPAQNRADISDET